MLLGDFGSSLTMLAPAEPWPKILLESVSASFTDGASDSSAPGSTSSKGVAFESFASDLLLLSSCFSSSSIENCEIVAAPRFLPSFACYTITEYLFTF